MTKRVEYHAEKLITRIDIGYFEKLLCPNRRVK
jgi:hypothetical protein